MTCCSHCVDAGDVFTRKAARRDLRRYRRRGPHSTSRGLLRMLSRVKVDGLELIDVGGGIGAIQHELMPRGLRHAVHVDASAAYLELSRSEASRRGYEDRVDYRYGDLVELDAVLSAVDIVALDRVICCYPDMVRLIDVSARHARQYLVLSYPRSYWYIRAGLAVGNRYLQFRGSAFRTYVHAPDAVDAEIRRHGFMHADSSDTLFWHVRLYRRVRPLP